MSDTPIKIVDMIKAKEEQAAAAQAEANTMRAIAEKFSDATPISRWKGGDIVRWESYAAHECVTHLDMETQEGNSRHARSVLYLEIGGGRLYSSRPVDLAAGFRAFCDGGCKGDIVDILRATAPAAERALAERQAAALAEQENRKAEKAAEKAAADIEKAQPVRVIGQPVRVTLDGIHTALAADTIPAVF